jgi:hypothetical protein
LAPHCSILTLPSFSSVNQRPSGEFGFGAATGVGAAAVAGGDPGAVATTGGAAVAAGGLFC